MGPFSHPEGRNKISNLMIAKLFYSHILNMNRGSLHTRTSRRIQHSVFLIQMIKMALQARKVSGAFKKRAHGDGKYLWCNSPAPTCRRWPLQSCHNQHTPLVPPEASDVQRSSLEPCTTYHPQYNEHSITFLQSNIRLLPRSTRALSHQWSFCQFSHRAHNTEINLFLGLEVTEALCAGITKRSCFLNI